MLPLPSSGPWAEKDLIGHPRQVFRAPSQAGCGNDIHTGSLGLRKAPTWAPPGRYSGSSGPVPGDDVLVDMRVAIVGATISPSSAISCACPPV
jgi:hypothetical protein